MTSRAARDAEYRRALGLAEGEPIPAALGQCWGHAGKPRRESSRPSDAKLDPDTRHASRVPQSQPPPGVDLGACDIELRHRRQSVAQRAVPEGNIDAQLTEFAEAIERAETARDVARARDDRLRCGSYVLRLKDRRDALLRSAQRTLTSV